MKRTYILFFILIFLVATVTADTDGLVSEWRCEDGITDSWGSNDGTAVGNPAYTTGVIGNACTNFSDSDYFSVADHATLGMTDRITICAWVKRTATNTRDAIVSKYQTSSPLRQFRFEALSTPSALNRISSALGNADGSGYDSSNSLNESVNGTGWNFVCTTWQQGVDSSYINLYVNGTEVSYADHTVKGTLMNQEATSMYIGRSRYTTGRAMSGHIDELTIWNKSLSDAEILGLYNDYVVGARPSGLVSYWDFERDGTDHYGLSGGTIHGSPTYTQNKLNDSINLNGTGDYVTVSSLQGISNDFTFTGWFKHNSTNPVFADLFKYDSGGANRFYLEVVGTMPTNCHIGLSSWNPGASDCGIIPEAWNHFVITLNGTNGSLYINGQLKHHAASIVVDLPSTAGYFGGIDAAHRFNGSFDEFSYWTRAFSPIDALLSHHCGLYNITVPLCTQAAVDAANSSLLTFYKDYENGNYSSMTEIIKDEWYNMVIAPDGFPKTYWFRFNVTGIQNKNITINVTNTMQWNFTGAVYDSRIVYKCPSMNEWHRLNTNHYDRDKGELYYFWFNITTDNSCEFATVYPFTYSDLVDRIPTWQSHSDCSVAAFNTSTDGRNLYGLEITNGSVSSADKKKIYIIARQHPSETSGSHLLNGMIDFILGNRTMKDNFIWRFIPMMNPDGVYQGNTRMDGEQIDQNRDWTNEVSGETSAVKKDLETFISTYGDPDVFLDVHGLADDDWHNTIYRHNLITLGADFYNNLSLLVGNITKYTVIDDKITETGGSSQTARGVAYGTYGLKPLAIEPAQHFDNWSIQKYNDTGINLTIAIYYWLYGEPYAPDSPENLTLYINKGHSACSDSYSRLTVSNPNTPWCRPTQLSDVEGGDTVYIRGGTYFGEFTMTGVAVDHNIVIQEYPGDYVYFKRQKEGYNETGNGLWTDVGGGFWSSNIGGSDTSYPRVHYTSDQEKFFTWGTYSGFTGSPYDEASWYDTTSNILYLKFANTATNPNNLALDVVTYYNGLYIHHNTITNNAQIKIQGIEFQNTLYGIDIRYQSNVNITDCNFTGSHAGIKVNGFDGNYENIWISDNHLNGKQNSDWYEQDLKSSGAEETTGIHVVDFNGAVIIHNNVLQRWHGGITLDTDSQNECNNSRVYLNEFHSGRGSQIEIEKYCSNSEWYNNTIYDSEMGVSFAPAMAVECSFHHNLVYLEDVIHFSATTTYPSYCVKVQNISGLSMTNWSIHHNTLWCHGRAINGDSAFSSDDVTWRDNILFSEEQFTIRLSGESINGIFYDHNDYWAGPNCTSLFVRWNDDTAGSTYYYNLSHARASADWDGTWDNNSLNIEPLFTDISTLDFRPTANSGLCDTGSDGGYIGAFDCSPVHLPALQILSLNDYGVTQHTANFYMTYNLPANATLTIWDDHLWTADIIVMNSSYLWNQTLTAANLSNCTTYWYNLTACTNESNCNSTFFTYNFTTTGCPTNETTTVNVNTGRDGSGSVAVVLFILVVTGALFTLGFKGQFVSYQDQDLTELVNSILRRAIWSIGLFLMMLNSAIVSTIAAAAGLQLENEMFRYMWLFGTAGYVFLGYLVLSTLINVMKLWRIKKIKNRMGDDD